MKPERPFARRGDYAFDAAVLHQEARHLVTLHHYAKGTSNTATDVHGLRSVADGSLRAIAWWLPPTRRAAESVAGDDWRTCVALSRLVVHPDEPQNVASMMIGASIRQLRADGRWTHLVTYADESQGHDGAIYRATNWEYVGRTGPYPRWETPDGRQVARLSTKSRTVNQMLDLGYKRVGNFYKRKFVTDLRGPT